MLGVEHPGYEPPPPPSSTPATLTPSSPTGTLVPAEKRISRKDSIDAKSKSPSSFRNPIPTTHSNSSSQSLSSAVSSSSTLNPSGSSSRSALAWPPSFYSDYTSRVWLTYRNTFPPIRDTALSCLEPVASRSTHNNSSSTDISQPLPSPSKPRWPWSGEKGWTSDAGWGCMLRTGQSLLANALIHLHLSRSWRRPTHPSYSPDYVQYVRILTWFLDNPSPLAPFGIHRMALAGKELGKEVGSWFGPSTAAGAIKRLVGEFEDAGLEVALAVDSVVYQSDVYAASAASRNQNGVEGDSKTVGTSKSRKKGQGPPKWGNRPVLILVGIRLGIDGVNPIYYESVKTLFTFPQTVGIAGGRPSSSYYFVGAQGDSLFYLDPHHTRPAIPLRPPPAFDETSIISTDDGSQTSNNPGKRRGSEFHMHSHTSTPDTSESERRSSKRLSIRRVSVNRMSSSYQAPATSQQATPTSPISIHSTSSLSQASSTSHNQHSAIPLSSSPLARKSISSPPPTSRPPSASPTRVASNAAIPLSPTSASIQMSPSTPNGALGSSPNYSASTLDPMSTYLATAYSISELRTFHCERVRKMPLSALDPSMLLGFLCRNEEEWKDLRERLAEMARTKKAIFSVQDEPPSWPDEDGDIDIESASDQEEIEDESAGVEDDLEDEDELEVKDRHSRDQSKAESDEEESDSEEEEDEEKRAERKAAFRSKSSRHDTIVGKARPEMAAVAAAAASKAANSQEQETVPSNEDDEDLDDDDDWVDPTKPSPPVPPKDVLANSGSTPAGTLGVERKGDQEDDASLTPTPASPSLNVLSGHQKSRSSSRDLPVIPTTLVSVSRESTTSSRPSSSSRRLSQVAISEAPVPFPTRSPDHRKHSSASSRSATSSSIPTSPASSQPTSSSHGHSSSYTYHRAHHSHERDATGYPFPGSTTDDSGTASSDSAPSSDALGGDEKHGHGRGSLVPKRERRTTVGRTAPMSGSSVGTPSPPPTLHYSSSSSAYHHQQSSSGTNGSAKAAKHGGRTSSGGVRAAVWKDEDGDDF